MTAHRSNSDGRGSVVVTGASRGIGRATALYLSAAGFSVFAGVRSAEDGARVEAEGNGRVYSLLLDVTDDDSIARAEARVSKAVGPAGLAGLVNNAAGGAGGPLEHITRQEMERLFSLNVHGVLQTARAFLPLLRRAQGRLVHVGGGGAGFMAIPLQGLVSASKYAVEGMTDALRIELRGTGVRVSLIEPGMTYAEVDKPVFRAAMNADFDRALDRVPEEQMAHYGAAIERARALNGSFLDRAAPPEVIARRIHHALTARRPRSRYWSGSETVLSAALGKLAPARVRDAIWGRLLGL